MTPYYQDEAVTIYHADCRDVLPTLGEVDLVLTDPPWGVEYTSGQIGPYQGQQIAGDDSAVLFEWAVELATHATAAVIFGSWRNPPQAARGAVVWDKGLGVGMGDLAFPWKPNFEVAYIFGDGWHGSRSSGVIAVNSVSWASNGQRQHPAEKPVALMRQFVAKAPQGVILDPFMGSGTTLRAAKDLGRKAIGIEIEERYCDIAAKRMAQTAMALD